MAEARRVVLDTNTVLSALLFVNGRLVPLRAAWQSGELTPLRCAQTVEELLRVLAYAEFKLTPEERDELLADYLQYGEVVAPWQVTGDQDLLRLNGQVKFQIIAPGVALELLTSAES